MRVAVSVLGNILEDYGTTIRAARLCDAMSGYGEVTLIAARIGRGSRNSGVRTEYISVPAARQIIQLPFWLLGLFRVMLKYRVDVVLCSNDWFGFAVFHLLAPVRKHIVVFEAHGILSEEYRSWGRSIAVRLFAQMWERYVIRHAYAVIAVSPRILNFYSKYRRNIALAPVFLDTERYRTDEVQRNKLRQHYGISGILIGLIGPFDLKFNQHALVFLHENLARFDRRLQFMVIGKGDDRIPDNRVIHIGYVKDYIDHLSCLDCVVVPCRVATSGPSNKILESMSAGLPVVATPAAVVGLEWATPGEDIIVCEETEIVRTVEELVFDKDRMRRIGTNARATVEAHYGREANEAKLYHALSQVAVEGCGGGDTMKRAPA